MTTHQPGRTDDDPVVGDDVEDVAWAFSPRGESWCRVGVPTREEAAEFDQFEIDRTDAWSWRAGCAHPAARSDPMTASEIIDWQDVCAQNLQAQSSACVFPEDAYEWRAAGFAPDVSAAWSTRYVTVQEAVEARRDGGEVSYNAGPCPAG